ncbi:hypothetical protein FB451DRAFT_1561199 [Mycena latifolia]|nr:hypothetical protein FB451DRAFT_1561199 [Mycena latifolia]
MSTFATLCKLPLSSSVNPLFERSLVSLDWIFTSGIPAPKSVASGVLTLSSDNNVYSMHMKLSVPTGLPYDVVLGRDWAVLSSNPSIRRCQPQMSLWMLILHLASAKTKINVVPSQSPRRSCVSDEPLVCRCPSTSGSRLSATTPMTSLTLLHDILLGHHSISMLSPMPV